MGLQHSEQWLPSKSQSRPRAEEKNKPHSRVRTRRLSSRNPKRLAAPPIFFCTSVHATHRHAAHTAALSLSPQYDHQLCPERPWGGQQVPLPLPRPCLWRSSRRARRSIESNLGIMLLLLALPVASVPTVSLLQFLPMLPPVSPGEDAQIAVSVPGSSLSAPVYLPELQTLALIDRGRQVIQTGASSLDALPGGDDVTTQSLLAGSAIATWEAALWQQLCWLILLGS